MQTSYAIRELKRWNGSYYNLKWDEALANAAWWTANHEGPCEMDGDEFGNTFT